MMDGASPELCSALTELLEDALRGLRHPQKTLSPKWLYDQRGSELFEQITTLPEYYPTRTETAILKAHAAQLAKVVSVGGALVELGSGASVKTRTLLDAGSHFATYVPIDISSEFLFETARGLQLRYPHLNVQPLVGDFTSAIRLPSHFDGLQKVGFFPGSTIGNLPRDAAIALLANARGWPGMTGFILGVDLVKDPAELVAAYDDDQGVTAKFISNILLRLNTDLGANFDLDQFAYRARWDADTARINMELVSTRDQRVSIGGYDIAFQESETIHVSAARKFTERSLTQMVNAAGWTVAETLKDAHDRFAVVVLEPRD